MGRARTIAATKHVGRRARTTIAAFRHVPLALNTPKECV